MRVAAASRRDFGRRDFCFPARILARFAAGSRRDFGRRDYCFPARILARFAASSRRDFGRRDFCFPARILARFAAGSRRDILLPGENLGEIRGRIPARFWPPGITFPGENLVGIPARFPPGRKIPAVKISPGSRRDSRRDRGGIPPRSRFLFYKGV